MPIERAMVGLDLHDQCGNLYATVTGPAATVRHIPIRRHLSIEKKACLRDHEIDRESLCLFV